jgi:hypothetical protein
MKLHCRGPLSPSRIARIRFAHLRRFATADNRSDADTARGEPLNPRGSAAYWSKS